MKRFYPLKKRIARLEEPSVRLEKRIDRLERRASRDMKRIATVAKRITTFAKRITTDVKRIASMTKRIASLVRRTAIVEKRIAVVTKRISIETKRFVGLVKRIASLVKRIPSIAKRILTLVSSIASLVVRFTSLVIEVTTVAIRFLSTRTRPSTLAIRFTSVRHVFHVVRSDLSKLGHGLPVAGTVFLAVGIACCGRSELFPASGERSGDAGTHSDAPGDDVITPQEDAPSVGIDSSADAIDSPFDAPAFDAIEEPVACEDGQNTSFPPSDCGTSTDLWFAWPYSPPRDIWVQRIELHTAGGNLAVLTDANGLPGSVLFQGTMPPTAMTQWIGVDVVPPLFLQAGVPYWLAEQAQLCSQALGGTQFIEYNAPVLSGPWTTTGTGSYTSHLFGVCQG